LVACLGSEPRLAESQKNEVLQRLGEDAAATLEHNTNKTPIQHEFKHNTPTNHGNINLYDIPYKTT
jgi:hypothetical protein